MHVSRGSGYECFFVVLLFFLFFFAQIVHRALCTRNVLVGSGMDVKIYNVGSFDMALDNREDGLVKWMAPETLFDGTNTTYSDV